jgi:hypothetical protein
MIFIAVLFDADQGRIDMMVMKFATHIEAGK